MRVPFLIIICDLSMHSIHGPNHTEQAPDDTAHERTKTVTRYGDCIVKVIGEEVMNRHTVCNVNEKNYECCNIKFAELNDLLVFIPSNFVYFIEKEKSENKSKTSVPYHRKHIESFKEHVVYGNPGCDNRNTAKHKQALFEFRMKLPRFFD